MFMKRIMAVAFAASNIAVASSAVPEGSAPTPAQADTPLVEIAGKTYSNTEITSFGKQLELSEGFRSAGGRELLDEFILTHLYDKIPTTATVEQPTDEDKGPSPYPQVEQRQLIKREFQTRLSEKVEVPRADMEAWYEKNQERYEKPERVHALHLFLETSEDDPTSAPDKVKARLLDYKKQVDGGTSFSQLAEEHSEAASGKAGGEIGMITRRMPIGPLSKPMNIELEEVFFSLPVGKVSDVVVTRHGMHLLYVKDRVTTEVPTLDDLVTSGILPGVLTQDRLTSMVQERVNAAVAKHKGVIGNPGKDEATTDTVAFTLDGKPYTLGNLQSVFGPRFSRFLDSVKGDSEALTDLMKQALEDEAYLLAAMDEGVDKLPDVADSIKAALQRKKARVRLEALNQAEASVTDAEILTRYNLMKDELRRPEAEGTLIKVTTPATSGTAEEARAREEGRKLAEDIRTRLEKEDIETIVKSLPADKAEMTSFTKVAKHIIGQAEDTEGNIFDQALSSINGDAGVGDVRQVGAVYAIAKLEKRYPGEPIALDVIKERLGALIRSDKEKQNRASFIKRLESAGEFKYLAGAEEFKEAVQPGNGGPSAPVTR